MASWTSTSPPGGSGVVASWAPRPTCALRRSARLLRRPPRSKQKEASFLVSGVNTQPIAFGCCAFFRDQGIIGVHVRVQGHENLNEFYQSKDIGIPHAQQS